MTTKAQTQTEGPLVRPSDRPPTSLGLRVKIRSDEDAELALRELGFLNSHAVCVGAGANQAISEIKAKADGALVLELEGEQVSYCDRRSALIEALEAHTKKAHPELQAEGGAKSLKLMHGEIGWVKARDSVDVLDGLKDSDVRKAIDASVGGKTKNTLTARLVELLCKVKLFCGSKQSRSVILICDVDFRVNKTKTLKAQKSGQITNAQLRKLKLQVTEGTDSFFADAKVFEPEPRAI